MTRSLDSVRLSLVALGLIVGAALVGLALQGNWPSALRVAAAGAVYLGPLWLWSRRADAQLAPVPWWTFALGGAAAGLASGLARSATVRAWIVGRQWRGDIWAHIRHPQRATVMLTFAVLVALLIVYALATTSVYRRH